MAGLSDPQIGTFKTFGGCRGRPVEAEQRRRSDRTGDERRRN
jgi:hypothetical protein